MNKEKREKKESEEYERTVLGKRTFLKDFLYPLIKGFIAGVLTFAIAYSLAYGAVLHNMSDLSEDILTYCKMEDAYSISFNIDEQEVIIYENMGEEGYKVIKVPEFPKVIQKQLHFATVILKDGDVAIKETSE